MYRMIVPLRLCTTGQLPKLENDRFLSLISCWHARTYTLWNVVLLCLSCNNTIAVKKKLLGPHEKCTRAASFLLELLFVKHIQQIVMWDQRVPMAVLTETILRHCAFYSPRAIHSKMHQNALLRMMVNILEWRLMGARSVCLNNESQWECLIGWHLSPVRMPPAEHSRAIFACLSLFGV